MTYTFQVRTQKGLKNNSEILIQNPETLSLKVNENKTKFMETIESDTRPHKVNNFIFKKQSILNTLE